MKETLKNERREWKWRIFEEGKEGREMKELGRKERRETK